MRNSPIDAPHMRGHTVAKKNSCDKKQRASRTVTNPKPLNRRGGGTAPTREITSEKRIADIRNSVRRHMIDFLKIKGIEVPLGYVRMDYINCLVCIDDAWEAGVQIYGRHIATEKPELADLIHEAFIYGHESVPDASLIWMIGAHMPFFTEHIEQMRENKEAQTRRQQNRRAMPKAVHQATLAQKLVIAGYSSGSRANVANQVAKASGLTT